MELRGSTINFLGDSITEATGASCVENGYVAVLERTFHLASANNYGIGGSRIARQQRMTDAPSDRDFCMRALEMDRSADAVVVFGGTIVVFGGTNDYGHGQAPLGTPGDRTPGTFYGACHTLMDTLQTIYCGKPILILTPLHRADENNPYGDGSKSLPEAPLCTYRSIILETAEYYGLPVLDLYSMSGITAVNETCRRRLLPDGLHPSDEGHALIARRIGLFLQTL